MDTHASEVAHRHGIELMLQFGSTVSGLVHPRSDVDVAVWLRQPRLGWQERGDLLGDLQALFPEREVDLVVLNWANPLLLRKIVENCRLLHGETRRFQEFRLYAFHRYQDYRRYLDLERDYVTRTLGERR